MFGMRCAAAMRASTSTSGTPRRMSCVKTFCGSDASAASATPGRVQATEPERLTLLTTASTQTLSVQEVLNQVIGHLVESLGATSGLVRLIEGEGKSAQLIVRAAERQTTVEKLAREMTQDYFDNLQTMGVDSVDLFPCATEHIPEMLDIIRRLIDKGFAYALAGDVYFDVTRDEDYGALSHRSISEVVAGTRVEANDRKRHPADFALWKKSKPGEPAWESPWGPGRPGWHIECSAMSWKHLGEMFDIHGGGIDLMFPHHENEVAQTRCAFHTPVMANYWMHNGFLQVEGEKMSKSLGNFLTIHDLLAEWSGEVLRLNMLRSHYRQPIDWTTKGLQESQKVLGEWYHAVGDTTMLPETMPDDHVLEALCDDLNTPNVLTRLHALASEIRAAASEAQKIETRRGLKASGALMGILGQTEAEYLRSDPLRNAIDESKIKHLIDARGQARKARDFKQADSIRDELANMGVEIEDHGDGTTSWKMKRKAS
jgi:cysteinyl-tRNA synthetase